MKKGSHLSIPEDILADSLLNESIRVLPSNYNFEIHKSVWQLRKNKVRRVALQFPEGLLNYSCMIGDILERFAGVEILIMGNVTYGACCVDDYTAESLGCDFIIHYGHSCLVPINNMIIKALYVFVEIAVDIASLSDTIRYNIEKGTSLAIVSTIQFVKSLQCIKKDLDSEYTITIPQSKPLSPGEVLGCTSPSMLSNDKTKDIKEVVYVGDGRFHLESMMISNQHIKCFYQYNPYNKVMSVERYDYNEFHRIRKQAIEESKAAKTVGVVLSVIGRQGNTNILKTTTELLEKNGIKYIVVLMSEIMVNKINMFENIDSWIQVGCPRLSIDWGSYFNKPMLTPYEAHIAFGNIGYREDYPMDYYEKSADPWTNYSMGKERLFGA